MLFVDCRRSPRHRLRGPQCNGLHLLAVYRELDQSGRGQECVWRDGRYSICDFVVVCCVVFLWEENSCVDGKVWAYEEGFEGELMLAKG